ncbi:insulinase family protein [bacterium]|nr:insulinase family protein [bacterium]MCP5462443.1 insulinase family protein [bacterium]
MRHIKTLENGLKIVSYEMPHMNSVSVGIWIGAGGRYETPALSGISHFIEHLVFKGTEKRSGKEITEAIEGIGGALNAFTGEEYTCYYARVLAEHFAHTFDVLWDMASNVTFSDEHIEKEKPVIKEEIMMYVDLPAQYVHDILSEVLWPGQPLGKMLIGTVDTVDAVTNRQLVEYKERLYTLSNIVVSVAGNIKHDSVVETICQCLSTTCSHYPVPVSDAVIEKQSAPEIKLLSKDTEQSHIAMGIRAYSRTHPDRYILKVLNTVLGENMSSRLFQEVREKHGLAYSIHSSVERFIDTGAVVISAGTDPKSTEKTIKIILSVLKNLKTELVPKEELDRAKQYTIGQLSLGLEKTMNIMMWLGETLLTQKQVQSIDEILEQITKVSAEDLLRVSNALFTNERLNMSIISPLKNESRLRSIFHF